jgi:hypothetical protein
MKFLVLFLGSTTLVAGGTAITSQQDVRNNVIAHQRPHQDHRATLRGFSGEGSVCPPVATPIFDNVARSLFLDNPDCGLGYLPEVDVDGDGVPEMHEGYYWRGVGLDCKTYEYYFNVDVKTHHVPGSNPPVIVVESYLDLNPDSMTYEGVDMLFTYHIDIRGYVDVTNDGKPDALLLVQTQQECGSEWVTQYFYVENISPPPSAACTTDVNSDGSTNVNDLLEVVANWGPCE